MKNETLCMGEFPLFPGWLFFELERNDGEHIITAYGSGNRKISCQSPSREYALAECLRKILQAIE